MLRTLHDLRYSCRLLKRAPTFAIFTLVILALGVGASTTMFAVVNAVLLEPLPFQDPHRLVTIQPDSGARLSDRFVYAWRAQSRTVVDIAGWRDEEMTWTGTGEPQEVSVDRTTPNFFALLGTQPLIGRAFSNDRTLEHIEHEVVLSYRLWQQRFRGQAQALGQSMTLNGTPFAIVGVMPSSFAIRTNERR